MDQSKIQNPKSKILLLTHRFPYPPDKGDRIRGYYWLQALAGRHDVDLLTFAPEPVPEEHLRAVKDLAGEVRVVAVSPGTAWPRLAKGFLTGKSLTESFFCSPDALAAVGQPRTGAPYDLGLAVCSSMGAVALNAGWVQRLIVDLVDVDSAKWGQYGRHRGGLGRWVFNRESRKIARLERRLADRAERMITVNPRECALLEQIAPGASVLAIPNGVDTDYFHPAPTGRPTDRLVFVGQMDYFPNIDAVLWFAEHVWPALSARHSELRWNIVGRNPARAVQRLSRLPKVMVTGAVPDVRPFLASAIAVAPLRVACGVQNKVLEAMAAGRPVVAAPNVVGGLDVRPQEELLIADSPNDWIAAIDLLLRDGDLQTHLADRARQAMLDRFTWSATAQKMRDCLDPRPPVKHDLPSVTQK